MYYKVENGVVVPVERKRVVIDRGEYKPQIDSQRYKLWADDQHQKFLIDFGLSESKRATIVCENAGEMLHALALVKTAFPVSFDKVRK